MLEFFCVNDNEDVDVKCPQTMRCITCYNSQVLVYNFKIQERKHLIIYNTTNGITTLKKHMNASHYSTAKMFEKEVNNQLKGKVKKQLAKKQNQIHIIVQLSNFCYQITFPKGSYVAKMFLENTGLLIIKNKLLVQFVESLWMKCLCLHLCPRLVFPSRI
jgi:hypothetical protein